MSTPVITFFNNKGGVGKTSLVYHLSWMFSEMGKRVVAIDLDPQANLTSAFLPDEVLEGLWDPEAKPTTANTIYRCIAPLTEVGDIKSPKTIRISENLRLVPGDLSLAGFEDQLSQEWPNSLNTDNLFRPFRILTAFWQVAQMAAADTNATIVLADVGPNLGAINRSALIGSDYVVIPMAADLFSLQGLRNLGPTLHKWRTEWGKRMSNWHDPSFNLPAGSMLPLGYIVQQYTERLSRPAKAYQRWSERIPAYYRDSVLRDGKAVAEAQNDNQCIARLKNYRSLVPMAQEARKPIFHLTAADGAIGNHSYAVTEARQHFQKMAQSILERMDRHDE